MRFDASIAEIVQFLQRQGYRVHFPVDAEITDEQARILLEGNQHAIVTRTEKGGFTVQVAEKSNRDLHDLKKILRAFCGFAHTIPTVGDDSFLVALPNRATFRIEIQPQAVPGNPPLNYCPCGRSIEKGATHCLACISTGKNQDRIPIVF